MTEVRRAVVVADPMGLHARPAARMAKAAGAFRCDATVAYAGQSADAKSIVQILGLFVPGGAEVEIVAVGADAAACVEALARLLAG